MHKQDVRILPKNSTTSGKKERQPGDMLLGKVKVPQFLSNFIEDLPGGCYYSRKSSGKSSRSTSITLGQRKGIGVPSNTNFENFVVTGKTKKNRLIVAFEDPKNRLYGGPTMVLRSVSFLMEFPTKKPTPWKS